MISNLKVELLSLENKERIMETTYQIFEELGVDVHSEEAIKLLTDAGCTADGIRVKIPRELVKKCIASAPSEIEIFDRNGNPAMVLGGRNSFFGAGPTCPNFMDPYTGERRPSRKEDAANAAKVCDALKDIDYAMSLVMIADKTEALADVHEVDAMVRNTTKPIATWAFTADNMASIIELCEHVAGGEKELREKPFLIVYSEPTSPFTHSKDAIEKLFVAAKKHVPAIYTPGQIMGGTAPVTICGALAQGLAETLTGCVLSQLVSEGAPFIAGTGGNPMDMKTMTTPYGSPESNLLHAGGNEMCHWLGLPSFDITGATEAKVVDAQAGLEVGIQAMVSLITSGNLIHDCGFMDCGLMGSLSELVMCDEIIGMAKRVCEGIAVDDFRLDFKTIEKVGPGGTYLQEKQTLKGYKKELHQAKIVERRAYDTWEADGAKTMGERCAEKVIDILENHVVEPLPAETIAKIDAVVEAAEKRVANK